MELSLNVDNVSLDVDTAIPCGLIINELVSNSMKYAFPANADPTKQNGRKNGISVDFHSNGNGSHTLIVKDNGVGFSMKDHERVFETFQRLHDQEAFRGAGIGLGLAKKIINQHGGEIWAEVKKNKGATFFFDLNLPI